MTLGNSEKLESGSIQAKRTASAAGRHPPAQRLHPAGNDAKPVPDQSGKGAVRAPLPLQRRALQRPRICAIAKSAFSRAGHPIPRPLCFLFLFGPAGCLFPPLSQSVHRRIPSRRYLAPPIGTVDMLLYNLNFSLSEKARSAAQGPIRAVRSCRSP